MTEPSRKDKYAMDSTLNSHCQLSVVSCQSPPFHPKAMYVLADCFADCLRYKCDFSHKKHERGTTGDSQFKDTKGKLYV